MRREDEEYAKTSFDEYLRSKYPNIVIKWEDVPQQKEPPDYYLDLGVNKIAVEVTTLMESVDLGGEKPITFQGVINWMNKFVREVEKNALKQGYLYGTYVISFNRPIRNFGRLKQQVQSDILNYIYETRSLESAPAKIVYQAPRLQKCTVQKVNQNTNSIYRAGPTNGKHESEAKSQITDLIVKSIHEKETKLSKVHPPKILVLFNTFANYEGGIGSKVG
ncbi:MAG: hypothetical protein IT314_02110 [Anaerolineales bacterium]|nr:hypothetical protein [Anaerolineales bacterium]